MLKKVFSIALALVMALSLLPVAAQAEGETVYTVTLSPGDGTGQDFVYRSDQGEIAANIRSAGYSQFYYETVDELGFCFAFNSCPAEWTAPEGYVFDGFVDSTGNGAVKYNTLTNYDTVFTARWRLAGEPHVNVSFPTTLDLNAFDEDGFLPLTVTFSDLDFGPNAIVEAYIKIYISQVGLHNSENGYHEIDLAVYNAARDQGGRSLTLLIQTDQSVEIALHADPDTLQGLPPLTYTGNLQYEFIWCGIGNDKDEYFTVPMRLLPLNTLTVNGGTGGGSYETGESVTVTADAPDSGKAFKHWDGAEGLTFTSGDATTPTATFTMPANNLALTATYDTGYTMTVKNGSGTGKYAAGCTVTATANAVAGKRFKEWDGAQGLSFISGSKTTPTIKFRMPSFTHTITATYEDLNTVTVNGGTGGGSYDTGESVTVTANDPDSGKAFKEWEGADGLTFTSGDKTTS
ncbi:MAG: hypothetical protein IKS78_06865, partial [Clostridia bacterium]|nr:hypothetical protein [Clostridia bacterium]